MNVTPKFIIVTGYHCKARHGLDWFRRLWWQHNIPRTKKNAAKWYAKVQWQTTFKDVPARWVFTIASARSRFADTHGQWITLNGDLGHCDPMLDGTRKIFMPQSPTTWMIGAWLAYGSEADLLYVEQDVLAFGPWIERIYQDIGTKQAIFGTGKLHKGSSTSLFMVKHAFIPQWCRDYLSEGPENIYNRLPEQKWRRMAERTPENYARLSFGYDTDRPFNPKDEVFYLQKITPDEMRLLAEQGLIKCDDMPSGVDLFSNNY